MKPGVIFGIDVLTIEVGGEGGGLIETATDIHPTRRSWHTARSAAQPLDRLDVSLIHLRPHVEQ